MPTSTDLPAEWLDRPVDGIGELALALGGDATSFTGELLRLIAKADPGNRYLLARGFPRQVLAWELWMATRPIPTVGEFLARLAEIEGSAGAPE